MKKKGEELFELGLLAFVYILFGLSSRSMANEENWQVEVQYDGLFK